MNTKQSNARARRVEANIITEHTMSGQQIFEKKYTRRRTGSMRPSAVGPTLSNKLPLYATVRISYEENQTYEE